MSESYDTCTWAGLTAPATAWRALGASRAETYTNTPHGHVEFSRHMRSDDTPREGYVHELLIRARHALPEGATDTQVVERAVILRAEDRQSRAIAQLAEALHRAAASSLHVDGSIAHVHTTLREITRLGGAS